MPTCSARNGPRCGPLPNIPTCSTPSTPNGNGELDSLRVVANYTRMEDPATVTPVGRELKLAENVGDITVRGVLDRMDERSDGEVVIIDYKTGKAPPERYAILAFFALKIYALLVQRQTGRTPAELRLMYLGNSTMYSIDIDRNTLDGIERQLRALTATIRAAFEKDNFPPRPSVLCGWCSFWDFCPEGQKRSERG